MGIKELYFQQVIENLFAQIQQEKVITQQQKREDIAKVKTDEELHSSSSNSKTTKPDEKYGKLLNKFSAIILSKLMEHGFNPFDIVDASSAIKKLLNAGMPVEHVVLDLQEHGKDVGSVENMLAQHGMSTHSGEALQKILENRSLTSGISYAEGLIEAEESKHGQDFQQIA